MPPPSPYPRGLDGTDRSVDPRQVGDNLFLHKLNGDIICANPGLTVCPVHIWTTEGLTSAHEYCRVCGLVRDVRRTPPEARGAIALGPADDPNVIDAEFREVK